MTEEEKIREMCRSNYAAQLAGMGYGPDGMALPKKENRRLPKKEDRSIVLLRAAHTLMKKQHDAPIVLNILAETVDYDGAECDGNCLLNDIEYYFDEIGVEIPEKERVNP